MFKKDIEKRAPGERVDLYYAPSDVYSTPYGRTFTANCEWDVVDKCYVGYQLFDHVHFGYSIYHEFFKEEHLIEFDRYLRGLYQSLRVTDGLAEDI